jgi:hypothetical protein
VKLSFKSHALGEIGNSEPPIMQAQRAIEPEYIPTGSWLPLRKVTIFLSFIHVHVLLINMILTTISSCRIKL